MKKDKTTNIPQSVMECLSNSINDLDYIWRRVAACPANFYSDLGH